MKNKYIAYAIFLVLALVLSVSSVFAAASFTADDMTFAPSEGERGQTVTQQLHLVNTGTDALTLSITSSMPSTYQAVLGQASANLAAGASLDVPVTIYVPLTQDSGSKQISGGITVTATNAANLTDSVKTYVETASMLEITKVQLDVDGDLNTIDNGENYDELKAGDSVKIIIKVSNEFSSADDYEIQDIEVAIEGDGDLDLDESDDMSDLDQGDDDTISFSFDIPSDADDGDDYDIDITVTGEDENGALHKDTFSATLEVSKESHDVSIEDARISPQTITCGGKVTITADITNNGKSNEDRVFLLIENDELDITEKSYSLALDRDDTVRKTYTFSLNNKTQPGTYDFVLNTFYGSDKQSDTAVLTLTVNPCQSTTTTTQPGTGTTTGTTTQPTIPQVIPTSGATPVYGTASFTDSPLYLIILVAAVIVLLLILIILLVKFVF